MKWLVDRARWLAWTIQSWFLDDIPGTHRFEHRPGSDDQWRTWTGVDGRPIPLNHQAAADRFEEGPHGR